MLIVQNSTAIAYANFDFRVDSRMLVLRFFANVQAWAVILISFLSVTYNSAHQILQALQI